MLGTTSDGAAHTRATLISAVSIAFLATAWLAVLARTYVRAVMIRNYGWDDAVMLLAVLTYSIYAAFNLVLASWGFGNAHLATEEWSFASKVASYILVTYSLHAATMVILKISLGIFYLRIVVSRWQRITVYTAVSIATIYGTYYFFAVLFACGLPSNFLANAYQGNCVGTPEGRFAINLTAGIINALSDFALAILPISLIRKACMPVPAKLSAGMVLLLGCVGSAVSIVRLAYVRGLTYNKDWFEVGVNITLWSIIEAGLCITAASLATLRPLCRCCIDTTRRTITAEQSFSEQSKLRFRRKSSMLSFQDRASASYKEENWPLKKPEATFPSTRELDDLRTPTPGLSEHGVTRKASLIHGKMQWLETHVTEPRSPRSPPQRPARPQWGLSADHPAYRQKPAGSASRFTYNPVQIMRTASLSKPTRHASTAGRARSGSQGVSHIRYSGEPKMEEVGVGAWRVCETKGSRKGGSGRA